MGKIHWLKGKQYPYIKSAADNGDDLALKILDDQISGDMSDETFQEEVNAFFEKHGGASMTNDRTEKVADSIQGKFTHKERYAFGMAEFDEYLSSKNEEYQKKFLEIANNDEEVREYLRDVKRHADEIFGESGEIRPSVSKEEIDKAIKFYEENPNYDLTGKGGGEIKNGRECFILLGPAGSGKTFLAKNSEKMKPMIEGAISFDPDKYRNADPNYSGVAKSGKTNPEGRGKYGLDENWNESGQDYRWNFATQGTQKAILGKWDKPDTMFGRAVEKGSNFIYQTVGDNDKKITDLVQGLLDRGYKVSIVLNHLNEGLTRAAVNSARRYNGGKGRLVDLSVTMEGFRSSLTFAKCLKMFKGNKNVDMSMNQVLGRNSEEGKKFAGNKTGSKEVRYGE